MRPPACMEPVYAVTYEVLDGDRPAPVSPAGYRLVADKQYRVLVRPYVRPAKIQQVVLKDSGPVEVHDSHPVGEDFEVRFKIKDEGWTFLPFRFVPGVHTLHLEVTIEGGGRKILVPVIVVNLLGALFGGRPLLSALAAWLAFALTSLLGAFHFRWLSHPWSGLIIPTAAFVLLYGGLLAAALSIYHWRLLRRARAVRRGLENAADEDGE